MSTIMSNQVSLTKPTTIKITKFRNYCCCYFKLSAVFLLLFVIMLTSTNIMVVKASIYDGDEGVNNNPATAANLKGKLVFAHVVSYKM